MAEQLGKMERLPKKDNETYSLTTMITLLVT